MSASAKDNARQAAKDSFFNGLAEAKSRSEDQEAAFIREVALTDLFFLLVIILRRADADTDFVYKQCREVEASPDNHIDLWSREHYKSTIITFALTIQEILLNPEITVGIFSHSRPIAKGFLRQIKNEFETNTNLYKLFPEIVYEKPRNQAPKWSEDEGIIPVRRKGNPKEATIEAWGLVDGQPTSKHYALMIYDDVVTLESVTTPEQMKKTTDAWAVSLNLSSQGGRIRYIGTRFHQLDTYGEMIRRGSATPRIRPATINGTVDGEPVMMTKEALMQKRRDMGPYVFACQMLLNPIADDVQGFDDAWLRHYGQIDWSQMNRYIICDPANSKKKENDYTVMAVIGLGADKNYYLIDMVRKRLNLTERTAELFRLHKLYIPIAVGYERYGMQSDIQHIEYIQEQYTYRFHITELGGPMPKNDRIRKLIPLFEQGRFFLPPRDRYTQDEGALSMVTGEFIDDEYKLFPVSTHDDMLDCIARIADPNFSVDFPKKHQMSAYYDYMRQQSAGDF